MNLMITKMILLNLKDPMVVRARIVVLNLIQSHTPMNLSVKMKVSYSFRMFHVTMPIFHLSIWTKLLLHTKLCGKDTMRILLNETITHMAESLKDTTLKVSKNSVLKPRKLLVIWPKNLKCVKMPTNLNVHLPPKLVN